MFFVKTTAAAAFAFSVITRTNYYQDNDHFTYSNIDSFKLNEEIYPSDRIAYLNSEIYIHAKY
jgi:NAD-specific glutamate dehydrogenase